MHIGWRGSAKQPLFVGLSVPGAYLPIGLIYARILWLCFVGTVDGCHAAVYLVAVLQTACMTALCRCAVGNVGLNVGIEEVESHRPITQSRVERFS